jgi:hypothetical protein
VQGEIPGPPKKIKKSKVKDAVADNNDKEAKQPKKLAEVEGEHSKTLTPFTKKDA